VSEVGGSPSVTYASAAGIGTITLDRPPVNAYDDRMEVELQDAWRTAADDEEAAVIILRAEGRHFCAGADLAAEHAEGAEHPSPVDTWDFQRDLPKPTIAAVQGACVAGGQRFVWPCDLIVAADDASFRDPLVAFGIPGIPAQGHAWEYGPRLGKEALFTGASISAERARREGMVNRVVPRERLDDEVRELAAEIARMDPFALAMTKRAVNETMDIVGRRYLVNRFQELMMTFDMDRAHQRAGEGGK
jgi:enoyl-CoA hydratase